jgi:hypothetical protein
MVAVTRFAPVWGNLIPRAARQHGAGVARRTWWRTERERLLDALQEIYLHAVGNRIVLQLPYLEAEFGLNRVPVEEFTLNTFLDMIHPVEGTYMVMGTAERPHPAILQYVSLLLAHVDCV